MIQAKCRHAFCDGTLHLFPIICRRELTDIIRPRIFYPHAYTSLLFSSLNNEQTTVATFSSPPPQLVPVLNFDFITGHCGLDRVALFSPKTRNSSSLRVLTS